MIKQIIYLSFAILIGVAGNVSAGDYSGGGDGSAENPYRIATPNDLNDIGSHPEDFNDCFILVNDINMADYTYTTALIAPDISSSGGFQGTPFTGIFDGNDCNISNLTIDTAGAGNDYLGLFGQIGQSGEVKNLGIEDVNITGGNDSVWLGGLCGENWYGTIRNCYATGSVTGDEILGGLCGENCGTISKCYATGSVTGGDGSYYLGGLCGSIEYGTISGCYFLDPGDGGGPDNGLGTALTETRMKQQNSFLGWDFVEIWNIGENQTYPYLRVYPAGDLNHDGRVDFFDFAIVADHWLEGVEGD